MPGSGDRWHDVDALFRAALDHPPGRRRAFLDEACSDEEVRARVLRLLDAEGASRTFLHGSVGDLLGASWEALLTVGGSGAVPDGAEPDSGPDRSGRRLGPYRLLRRLGRGGMATVYLGERGDGLWDRRVAVKILRRGLDTEDVIRRFHEERRILSALDHPNIARLLDGGSTPDGLPFLVMEHVDGIPITRYCDERTLSVEGRLELFCAVGRAVQHAHRALVVHRDLKPSNILVTTDGRVKLLDFGIAKILDPTGSSPRTRTAMRRLTPAWASPEQLSGGPITTASDVFQLGLLLGELVGGERPYRTDRAGSPEAVRRLLEGADPTAPSSTVSPAAARQRGLRSTSALSRRLRGDIDTIVLRAAAPEPERRYPSAEALVEDVERHRTGLPIRARPATTLYRVRKLMRRRPWVGPAAALLVLVAVGYVLTLVRHSAQLERERDLARAEATRAAEVQQVLMEVLRSVDPWAPDATASAELPVREILDAGAERVRRSLESRPGLRGDLLVALAAIHANLDRVEPARSLAEEALALHRAVDGERSVRVAHDLRVVGALEARSGRGDRARLLLTRSLALARASNAPDSAVAGILTELGTLEQSEGRTATAEEHLREAVALLAGHEPPPREPLARANLALSATLLSRSRVGEARQAAEEAIRLSRLAHGDRHPGTAMALQELADIHDWEGRGDEAVPLYREAISILDEALGSGHVRTLEARNNLAVTLRQLGELAEAEALQRRIVAEWRSRAEESPHDLASTLQNLGVILQERSELEGAEAAFREALTLYDGSLPSHHFRRAFPRLSLAAVLLARGDPVGAERVARDAGEILEEALPSGNYVRATAQCRLGRALAGQDRTAEARDLLEAGVASLASTREPSPRYERECREALAVLYRSLGRDDLAREQEAEVDALLAARR